MITVTMFLSACITGLFSPLCLAYLNLLTALGLTGWWVRRYVLYPHKTEQGEIIGLVAELISFAFSIFFVCRIGRIAGLLVVQYMATIIHLLVAICLLLFFLFFKIKKLF